MVTVTVNVVGDRIGATEFRRSQLKLGNVAEEQSAAVDVLEGIRRQLRDMFSAGSEKPSDDDINEKGVWELVADTLHEWMEGYKRIGIGQQSKVSLSHSTPGDSVVFDIETPANSGKVKKFRVRIGVEEL